MFCNAYFFQETLPCDQCEKRFSTKTRRKDHQKQVHRKNFKCDKVKAYFNANNVGAR